MKRKIEWKKTVTRPLSPLKASSLLEGLDRGISSEVGVPLKRHLLEPVGEKHAWYVCSSEWEAFVREIVNQCSTESYFEWFKNRCLKTCQTIKAVTSKIAQIGPHQLSKSSKQHLAKLLREYHDSLFFYPFIAWGFLIIDRLLVQRVKACLESVLHTRGMSQRFDEFFDIFATKTELLDAEKEEWELLDIKRRARFLSEAELDELLEAHTQKYGWLPMYDHNINPWGKHYFQRRLRELPENASAALQERMAELDERRHRLNTTLQFLGSEELERLVRLLQEYLVLRTYRTDILRIAYFNIAPLLTTIAEKIRLETPLIPYLTIDEIYEALDDTISISPAEVERRMEHVLLLNDEAGLKVFSKKEDIERILNEHLGRARLSDHLEGEGVWPGVVRGRVKIVEDISSGSKLEKGDILVATMTTPEMHNMIERAAAIVTDEGGITCHAAIVARELRIPCVIATENATKVLRDGDLVEVDAERGIVRRLE